MEGDSAPGDKSRKERNPANLVIVSGLFGLAAAGIMYFDAASQGGDYLRDMQWIIIIAAVLGAISLLAGLYLYNKQERK